MRNAKKSKHAVASNVVAFPAHLIGMKRQADGTWHKHVRTKVGEVHVYAGDGMTAIDACVPHAVAARMLAAMKG